MKGERKPGTAVDTAEVDGALGTVLDNKWALNCREDGSENRKPDHVGGHY